MQKKIIALALAAGLSGAAFAQSNVTISGLARMSYEMYSLHEPSNAANFDANTEHRVSDQSSMLVFSGREDLGGGMYAVFQVDNRWGGDLGGLAATGNTHVGIGGTWGAVRMGRQDLHYGTMIESYKAYTLQNILGNALLTQVSDAATSTNIANATRTPNTVWYDSPNWNGFSVRVAGSTQWAGNANEGSGLRAAGGADGGKGGAGNVALTYRNGPIVAGYSFWSATREGGRGATVATADQRGDTMQFGYSFPNGFRLGLAANSSRVETDGSTAAAARATGKRMAWVIPVAYTFGNNELAFTYAHAGNFTSTTSTGAKAYTVAYGHSLSKRTNVGVAFSRLVNERLGIYNLFANGANGSTAVTAANPGMDVSQFSLNVNHSF